MASSIRTIVAGVALLDELDPVLPSAVRLAESVGAELHVVHVLDDPDPILQALAESRAGGDAGGAKHSSKVDAVTRMLDAHCARLGSTAPRVKALVGSAHDRLTRYADEVSADLIVVGATRRGRIWRNILGTTAERVLKRTTVPVMVLHQPFFHSVRRVLLTTDLSALSAGVHERGLDAVEALFGTTRMEVRSLFVLPVYLPGEGSSLDDAEEVARVELADFLAERRDRAYAISPRVRLGDTPSEINVEADASGSDLIVLGTHGRSGFTRYMFGSVAAATLRDAARNVLVVPAVTRAPPLQSKAIRLDAGDGLARASA